jgi:hypothetical protein
MSNPHDHPTALKDLQDSIYREKVLRARAMTPAERVDSVFELSDLQLGMMLGGAMHRIGTTDPDEGRNEVRRWLDRLAYARDFRFYATQDLDDARDVLVVQGPETLDMNYIERWCETHGTTQRLKDTLESLPPL